MPLLTSEDLGGAASVFRGRLGEALWQGLSRVFSIDRINELYDTCSCFSGSDFAGKVLAYIGADYQVLNPGVLSALPDGPFITISNHPYGSIDGLILVDIFGHARPDFKVMVNGFLGRIEPMRECFICVTPNGNERNVPTQDSIKGVKDAISHVRAGHPLGIFPSGAVSDFSMRDGCVRDREWQEPVLRMIRRLEVPVVPVHFLDMNSWFYYSLGLVDWRVRLLRLPSEVFNKRGKRMRVALGEAITPEQQRGFADIADFGTYLRNTVYKQY